MRAISPNEATKPPVDALSNAIGTVNKCLGKPWSGMEKMSGRAVSASLLAPWDSAVVESFREAGWAVDFVPDSRDGNYYTFKPKQ